MICQKEFTIDAILTCSGLTADAPWIYIPDVDDTDPLHVFDYSIQGYSGEYTFEDSNSSGESSVYSATLRLEYVGVAGKTLKLTHSCSGVFNLVGVGSSNQLFIRSYVNGVWDDQTANALAGAITPVSLVAEAQQATTVNNVAYIIFQINTRGTSGFNATINLQCF